ncbi:pentapeptide repeat-containing protein [Desulfococcaceae bacterium HSG8]|nr:pentapeptide repeat-containing protein [Desulfococcaceae bacterium HSG8]
MKRFLIRALLIFICFCLNIAPAFAEEVKRGHNGPVKKTEMRVIFENGETVDGRVINGNDLIEIIKETDLFIRIKNSIIEKGLDFERLPPEPVKKEALPKEPGEEYRKKILKKHKKFRIVNNEIEITNSEIQSRSKDLRGTPYQSSVFAPQTIFYKNLSFWTVTFKGNTDFNSAIFSRRADFFSSAFGSLADFASAAFSGPAFFNSAVFSSRAGFGSATFNGAAYFGSAVFGRDAEFWEAEFMGRASFNSAAVTGKADFRSAMFNDYADFRSAEFGGYADFRSAEFGGYADFRSAAFKGCADFRSSVFSRDAEFWEAEFSGYAFFNTTIFSGDTYFKSVIFRSKADFTSAAIIGKAYFRSAIFTGDADFRSAAFTGDADFSSSVFSGYADFTPATFNAKADFGSAAFRDKAYFDSAFRGDANFKSASFSGYTYFRSATFGSNAYFDSASFRDYTYFRSAAFRSNAYFDSASFNGDTDFGSAVFSGDTSFSSVIFKDKADFTSAIFSSDASFRESVFSGEVFFRSAAFRSADFILAIFTESLYFQGAEFSGILDIGDSKFRGYADFRETRIRKLVSKSESPNVVKAPADFRKAKISEAHFQYIIFENEVDFSDAEFGATDKNEKDSKFATVFRSITFKSNADFIRTKFSCDTAFEMIKFRKDVNFKHARFKEEGKDNNPRFWFSYIDFKNLLIKWEQLPEIENIVMTYDKKIKSFRDIEEEQEHPRSQGEKKAEPTPDQLENLSEFFQDLEANFRSQDQLEDANEAFFHTKMLDLEAARKGEDTWERVTKELEWIFWGIPCGYGTKIWRVVWGILIFHLFFSIIYFAKGGLFRVHEEDDTNLKERSIFDFPNQYISDAPCTENYEGEEKLKMAHRFSMAFLFKFGRGKDTVKIKNTCKYFVWTEWVLGFYLWFCFVVTSSNTFPLINRLIEGVF